MGIFQIVFSDALDSKFLLLFLPDKSLKKIFSEVLGRQEAFHDNKIVNYVKSKKWVFSKGVNPWFWLKNSKFVLVGF